MNTLDTVTNTAGTTKVLVEEYLEKKYLAEREYETPLAQSAYGSARNLPERSGQHVKFTRRNKLRLPEVAKLSTDPLSDATLSYEQKLVPIEFINDHTSISVLTQQTAWIDLAKDFRELTGEAIMRYLNRAVQAAFLGGRYKPGYRNASGVTVGDATYPHFWTSTEAAYSPSWGGTFTFEAGFKSYTAGRTQFSDLLASDYVKMDDFRRMRVKLATNGAKMVGGKYIAAISEAIQADLERDDEYFRMAIRNGKASDKLINGEIVDYAGFKWVKQDEPWILATHADGGDGTKLEADGKIHVAHVFGQDAFGYLRLGGKNASKPQFKLQDLTTTGKVITLGYVLPFQAMMLNGDWGGSLLCPVRDYNP